MARLSTTGRAGSCWQLIGIVIQVRNKQNCMPLIRRSLLIAKTESNREEKEQLPEAFVREAVWKCSPQHRPLAKKPSMKSTGVGCGSPEDPLSAPRALIASR
jgi:hypothetical protein